MASGTIREMARAAAKHPEPDASGIRLLVLDVDGVLTDGSITYDNDGRELKTFNTRDGFGIKLWIRSGGKVALLTGRGGGAVRTRAEELGITEIVERVEDKGASLTELLTRLAVRPEETAYVGDDWPDLPAMAIAGYPIAVRDAEMRVKRAALWITTAPGGRGAVRQVVEHLLDREGRLEEAAERRATRP